MPIFMSSEEFEQCSRDVSLVAEKADAFVREIMNQLETVKAQGEAASITAEQTCSLLEQKYVSLTTDLNALQSQHSELNSTLEQRLSDIAQLQTQNHQINILSMEKDGEIERLKTETVELHKSKRQLMELVEQRDLEIREKNSIIKSYLDKIVNLTENAASKEARISDLEAELAQSQVSLTRISQEKELVERHNSWLNDELKTKLDDLIQLRKIHGELEAEMCAKLSDGEKRLNETSSALKWNKDRVAELESKLASLEKELMSAKDAATTSEKQFSSEISTLTKLVDLYKENSEEWSKKSGDLEGVIKALETHLNQVENEYKEKLGKEVLARKQVEKDADGLKEKLDLCLAELESLRKTDELKLIPLGNFVSEQCVDPMESNDVVEESRMIVHNVPAGVSTTALAASLLRDGWSLAKLYTKYQEAVDALRHEQLGRKQSQAILERVLHEIEQKAGVILDERAEHERTIEAYSALDQKLQHSLSEQTNLQRLIQELKADLRRKERENALAQKEIVDLQNQVSVLLKECQDIQLRCGSTQHDYGDVLMAVSDVSSQDEYDAGGAGPVMTLAFKDISGLVEQNAKLRHLVRTLSEDNVSRETELKEQYERELQKLTEEATTKVSAVLARAEEQQRMIESLHTSVAMYKKLYEEAHKLRSSGSLPEEAMTDEGRQSITTVVDGYLDSSQITHNKLQERVRYLEEELDKSRSEIISLRSDRDKLVLEARLAQEKLERFMKDFEHQRDQQNRLIARNVEFSQLIIDYQRKMRESSDLVKSAEELSRKLTMEISLLKQEKEILINSEKRASDEVRSLSERVHRLQASLDTIQSAEEVREEARCAERRHQELHIKQIEREWAEAKKELHEEREKVRQLTLERDDGTTNALKQAEESRKELSKALRDLAAAEARASVAEARCSDFEGKMNSIHFEASEKGGPTYAGTDENTEEEIARLREEVRINNDHMLQYKSIALTNEEALKQLEAAYEKSKEEADSMKKSLEDELLSLKDALNELQGEVDLKSKELEAAVAGKEEAVANARLEVRNLEETCSAKEAEIALLHTQISSLKDDMEKERKKASAAQANYERQVILQSDTIQELNKTSQALADLQEEVSELRRSNDAFKAENDELKAKWEGEKTMLEVLKNDADRKYDEVNELNKVLHSRLEALHIKFAENDRQSSGGYASASHSSLDEVDGLQSVVKYLRRSKEIAETEISLLKSERLRLQSQLETALMAAETAQASLDTARKSSKSFFSEEEFKSLQLQVREISLLRESNIQLREENKQNFEECQKLRETYEKARSEIENLERSLEVKQNEVEALRKEVENQSLEKIEFKKNVDELLERFKNVVDVEEYNHMKEAVQRLQTNLGEKEAQLEDVKRQLSDRQGEISRLEAEVSRCRLEISEKESRINSISQTEVSLRSELEKQRKTINILRRNFTREKDDLSREKEALSKQLEEAKQGKRTTGDAADEQAAKEREKEKDARIQGLERTLERLREELRKEKEGHKIEKARRGKTQKTVSESLDAVVQQRTKLSDELEKHKHGLKLLVDEVENLKQGEGNLPAGSTDIQFFSGTLLEDLVAKYHQAVENFKLAAQPVLTETVPHGADSSSTLDTASTGSTLGQVVSAMAPAITSSSSALSAANLHAKAGLTPQRASLDSKKVGRRLVRPRISKPVESQGDIDMPEAEGPDNNTVTPSSIITETHGDLSTLPAQPPLTVIDRSRKRPSLAISESTKELPVSEEATEPSVKKFRNSETPPQDDSDEGMAPAPPESIDGQQAAANVEDSFENFRPGTEESLENATDLPADADKDENVVSAGKLEADEPALVVVKTPEDIQVNEGDDVVDEGLNMLNPDDELVKNVAEQDLMEQPESGSDEREEGELVTDIAAEVEGVANTTVGSPEIGELLQSESGGVDDDDSLMNPSVAVTEVGEAETSPLPVDDDKNEVEGGAIMTESTSVEESSDRLTENVELSPASETADEAPELGAPGKLSPTPASTASDMQGGPHVSPVNTSSGSTTINLRQRAKERSILRRGLNTPSSVPPTRGRGRMMRGRGRSRGPPPSGQQG